MVWHGLTLAFWLPNSGHRPETQSAVPETICSLNTSTTPGRSRQARAGTRRHPAGTVWPAKRFLRLSPRSPPMAPAPSPGQSSFAQPSVAWLRRTRVYCASVVQLAAVTKTVLKWLQQIATPELRDGASLTLTDETIVNAMIILCSCGVRVCLCCRREVSKWFSKPSPSATRPSLHRKPT